MNKRENIGDEYMLEVKELQYFVVCADLLSFSKAADVLYTTQPNVSKVVKSLEEKLGFAVFDRDNRGIKLTRRGRQAYEYASRILEQEKQLAQIYKIDDREEFSISSNPSSWMARCFTDYYIEYAEADIRYNIMEGSVNNVIKRVGTGLDDLGFIFFMDNQMQQIEYKLKKYGLEFTKLNDNQAYLYYGNNSPIKDGQTIEEYLRGKMLVQCYEDEFALNHYWDNIRIEDSELDKHVAVITNSDYVMNYLLKYSRLCNISSSHFSKKPTFDGIPLYNNRKNVVFGYISKKDEELSLKMREFLEFVKNELKRKE